MTKKDFELIAALLKATYASEAMAKEFADALRATNKQFNRDKFLRACGVGFAPANALRRAVKNAIDNGAPVYVNKDA